MSSKETTLDERIREIDDNWVRTQHRIELLDEVMRLTVGGCLVLYLLGFAYEIISRLPPYVQP